MADVILSDGREITFDLLKISLSEYRALFDAHQPEEEDAVLARVAGLTVDEYRALPVPDWRALAAAFFRKAREPLETAPNSASASISTSDTESQRR